MITPREEEILKIIVNEYTSSAQPVSSKRIMELMGNTVSSATIRNECAFLENQNYLEKEHTSSGRVPSSKGYRYYVDNLMGNDAFDTSIFDSIEALFDNRSYSIDQIIEKSSNIISEMTNSLAIVSTREDVDHLKIRKIEMIPLTNKTASVIFILNNGDAINKVYCLDEQHMNDLPIAVKLFNDNLTDMYVEDIPRSLSGIEGELKTMVKNYEDLFRQFLSAVVEQTKAKSQTYGISNMLVNPEFTDISRLKNVMKIITSVSPFDWFDYNYQGSQKNISITTKIGFEINPDIDGVDDLAIIGAEFNTNGSQKNAITLIGPKRMRYDEANILLQFLIDKINGLTK
ncbi:heat-inducible transcriptional repressor HrcA [Mesoplasma lactucae]|uniref:Heat-inducible transcription repressor HrcA n=1 Tax=Mesoplasma lactucae ATCC 49193 TaxID=81460 RepID=A0A291IRD0_9MOLU|nr:heat-inducible transcriptional repressor HrcA [Mesoplasma lactucae]ATG97333.1 heat-inducible transcription repressor HrcA [Mesoplasma lactucae ATCC 49193]ATZ20216.1 heat-inducible transcription repressor HrcA [Mesoplasma lactucae ATCC 49193]MCL8216965.1 Heat-inducible transcription repressor HrcA [Mesoplasma lactucae ATCC 49193]